MNIKIENLKKSYGSLEVLEDVTFSLEESCITLIIGPSGCGKTTILNIISGISQADSGSIIGIEGRKFSYCFQEPRLLGWLSAEDNLRFALGSLLQSSSRIGDI